MRKKKTLGSVVSLLVIFAAFVSLTILVAVAVNYNVSDAKVEAEVPNNTIQSKPAAPVTVQASGIAVNEIKEATSEKMEEQQLIKSEKIQKAANDQKKSELQTEIQNYLGNSINNIGLSYYDINSGDTIVINGDKTFLAGSTVKVQMNMVLYDMFQNGQANKNENLRYSSAFYEAGTGILQGSSLLSKPLNIMLLSQYSIEHSDNIATNMIINRIGYQKLRNAIDDKLGHATNHSGNYITANDETSLLKLLYTNPNNNTDYPQIIDFMKNTDFHDRLDLYVPHNVVAHKIGDYSSYVNDVGIIYTQNPYILSIYTNSVTNADEVIAHISKLIYDYQNSLQ